MFPEDHTVYYSHAHVAFVHLLGIITFLPLSSAINTGVYLQRPVDVTVAQGQAVAFRCGVPQASPQLTLTFHGTKGTYNLTCPNGYVEAGKVRRSTAFPAFTHHASLLWLSVPLMFLHQLHQSGW